MSEILGKFVPRSFLFVVVAGVMSGCSSYELRTTDLKPADLLELDTPEELLLDVGIQIFEPDFENIPSEELVFVSVRESESVWIAQQLKSTLESSNAWGVVRLVPDDQVVLDLQLQGEVLQSDGENLRLHVTTYDSAGRVWLDKEYTKVVSKFSYEPSQANREPFQGLYNEISNDLLLLLKDQTLEYRADLRTISSIKFARSFSPEAFDAYLVENDEGYYQVDRLPAENDPLLERVQQIQLRDQMFVDILQDYYVGFTDQMDEPYLEWRAQSFRETQVIRELENSARAQRLSGWLSILGGTAGLFSNSTVSRQAGSVAIFGGSQILRDSFQKRDEAALHIEILSEVGRSIEAELEPTILELQDRTITLTGTVRNQYDEWREILREIYYRETGYAPTQADIKADSIENELL